MSPNRAHRIITIDPNVKLQLTNNKQNYRAQSNPRALTENLESVYQNKKTIDISTKKTQPPV